MRNAFDSKCLRLILVVRCYRDMKTDVRRMTKQEPSSLRRFGHVCMDEERLLLKMLKWCPNQQVGGRMRGRATVRLFDAVVHDTTAACGGEDIWAMAAQIGDNGDNDIDIILQIGK